MCIVIITDCYVYFRAIYLFLHLKPEYNNITTTVFLRYSCQEIPLQYYCTSISSSITAMSILRKFLKDDASSAVSLICTILISPSNPLYYPCFADANGHLGNFLLYPPQTKFGGVYRFHPVCLSVCPSVRLSVRNELLSATPPKRLAGFL